MPFAGEILVNEEQHQSLRQKIIQLISMEMRVPLFLDVDNTMWFPHRKGGAVFINQYLVDFLVPIFNEFGVKNFDVGILSGRADDNAKKRHNKSWIYLKKIKKDFLAAINAKLRSDNQLDIDDGNSHCLMGIFCREFYDVNNPQNILGYSFLYEENYETKDLILNDLITQKWNAKANFILEKNSALVIGEKRYQAPRHIFLRHHLNLPEGFILIDDDLNALRQVASIPGAMTIGVASFGYWTMPPVSEKLSRDDFYFIVVAVAMTQLLASNPVAQSVFLRSLSGLAKPQRDISLLNKIFGECYRQPPPRSPSISTIYDIDEQMMESDTSADDYLPCQ